MAVKHEKARKLVAGAMYDLQKNIEEANKLLAESVKNNENRLLTISAQIERLYKELDTVQANKLTFEAEIMANKDLLNKVGNQVKRKGENK